MPIFPIFTGSFEKILPTALILLLLNACTSPTPAVTPTVPTQAVLPYSFRSMAFDGEKFWQVVSENNQQLISQSPTGKELSRTTIQGKLPAHRNLSWGQNRLWLLDEKNTLYSLRPDGKVESTLQLADLPEPDAAEQIVWAGKELWLLFGAYISAAGKTEAARLYHIDPETGKILATLTLEDDAELKKLPRSVFSGFRHQNLAVDNEAFYVARGNIFEKIQNGLYRIDRKSGLTSFKPFERIYTGLGTAFFWQGSLYGIELLDTSNCGEYCRGKLEKL